MRIYPAAKADLDAVTALALLLWPAHDFAALREEMAGAEAVFLAEEDGRPIGFAQCGLRHDYVEGTDSSPVGYLEGIYVMEPYRRTGVARALVEAGEDWARARGCREFASDCEIENAQSLAFHLGAGFAEAGRLICFVKGL